MNRPFKTRILGVFFAALCCSQFGCERTLDQRLNDVPKSLPAVAGEPLPQEEIRAFETAALAGDAVAANALARHHSLIDNEKEGEYWSRIAAENGHIATIQRYSGELWSSGGFYNCKRALYWMNKVSIQMSHESGAVADEVRSQLQYMTTHLGECENRPCIAVTSGGMCERQ